MESRGDEHGGAARIWEENREVSFLGKIYLNHPTLNAEQVQAQKVGVPLFCHSDGA
jgi:hypothetical protein